MKSKQKHYDYRLIYESWGILEDVIDTVLANTEKVYLFASQRYWYIVPSHLVYTDELRGYDRLVISKSS